MPRFIISIQELYDRDHHGTWRGIDTGFGAQPAASETTAMSVIAFADVGPNQDQDQAVGGDNDDSEAIRLEVLRNGTRQV